MASRQRLIYRVRRAITGNAIIQITPALRDELDTPLPANQVDGPIPLVDLDARVTLHSSNNVADPFVRPAAGAPWFIHVSDFVSAGEVECTFKYEHTIEGGTYGV